jgi:hypothetical protein
LQCFYQYTYYNKSFSSPMAIMFYALTEKNSGSQTCNILYAIDADGTSHVSRCHESGIKTFAVRCLIIRLFSQKRRTYEKERRSDQIQKW